MVLGTVDIFALEEILLMAIKRIEVEFAKYLHKVIGQPQTNDHNICIIHLYPI